MGATRLLSGKQDTLDHLASQCPRGLATWWGFAPWRTCIHCLGLFHMPSLPALFPVSASRFYCWNHSPAPHLLLFGPDSSFLLLATQTHRLTVFLIFAKYEPQQSECCHKYPALSILLWPESHLFSLPTVLKHAPFIHWCTRQVHLIPSPLPPCSLIKIQISSRHFWTEQLTVYHPPSSCSFPFPLTQKPYSAVTFDVDFCSIWSW